MFLNDLAGAVCEPERLCLEVKCRRDIGSVGADVPPEITRSSFWTRTQRDLHRVGGESDLGRIA